MLFDQYDYIYKVIETGSITEAANQLFISQSALSQRIISLEKAIGARLFDRDTTPLTLTFEGELFYKMLLSVTASRNDFLNSLSDFQNAQLGHLNVAMTTFRSQQILHLLLPQFKAQFPRVDFLLLHEHHGDLEKLVSNGKADLAFISRSIEDPDLNYLPLAEGEFILSVPPSHPIATEASLTFDWRKRPPLDLSRLSNESFIMIDGYPHFTAQITQIFEAYGFEPKVYLKTADFYTVHQLSINNAGFTIIHDSAAIQQYPHGVYFRLDRGPVKNNLRICYRQKTYLSEIMKGFIELARNIYKELYTRDIS